MKKLFVREISMFLCDITVKFWTFSILLSLKEIFWETQNLFKKLEYTFLVESTKIENATFPYKTALSEANVKTNKIESKNCTYITTNGFLPVTTLFFRKFCFSLRTSYKELVWCTSHPNIHIHTFGVLFEGDFP